MAGADDEARRKSRSTGPCAVARTVSGLSAPCEIPDVRSSSTERRKPSRSSSLTLSPSILREPAPFGQPRDECGVAGRSASPGRHDLWDPRAGVGRQEGQVRLVLHLLQAVEDECGPRISVDAEAPHLAQPLRVSGVAPVDRKFERPALRVRAGEGRHAPFLARHGGQPVDFDLQVADRIGHLGRRGETVGRAHGEVAGGRRAPPHNHRGNDTEREAVGADHRAERGDRDRADHQATHRTAQVRQARQRDRRCHGQLEDREARVEAGEVRNGRAAGRGAEQRIEQEADEQGGQPGHAHLAHGRQPRHEQADQDQRHDDADGPQEPQRGDQPVDTRRRGSDELGDVDLHRGVGLDQRDADHHQHGGDADADGVGGPAPGRAASVGPQQEGADALAPGGVPDVVRNGRQLGAGGRG